MPERASGEGKAGDLNVISIPDILRFYGSITGLLDFIESSESNFLK
jgi:hypothetical protein